MRKTSYYLFINISVKITIKVIEKFMAIGN